VAAFNRAEDAYMFRSFLVSHEINSYVFDEYIPQWFWYYTQAIGGVRVAVANEDYETAKGLHREYAKAIAAVPLMEPARGWPIVAIVSLIFWPIPMIIFGRKQVKTDSGESQSP